MPLIAPKVSFTGIEWWTTFEEGLTLLAKTIGHRDYIIPTPSRDRKRIMPIPLGNSQALRIYRAVLQEGGLSKEEADRHTLSEWRVYMPEESYKAGISKERRAYLGRWAGENMADTYTRDHRTVVCGIWHEVLGLGESISRAPAPVPVNLAHSYYDLDEAHTDRRTCGSWGSGPRRVAGPRPAPTTLPLTEEQLVAPIVASESSTTQWHDIAGGAWSLEEEAAIAPTDFLAPSEGDGFDDDIDRPQDQLYLAEQDDSLPSRRMSTLKLSDRIPFDQVPRELGGPYQLIVNNEPTWSTTHSTMLCRAHFRKTTGECVCGWQPKKNQYHLYDSAEAWQLDYHEYKGCDTCWRLYTASTEYKLEPGWDLLVPEGSVVELPDIISDEEDAARSHDGSSSSDPESGSEDEDGAELPLLQTVSATPPSSSS